MPPSLQRRASAVSRHQADADRVSEAFALMARAVSQLRAADALNDWLVPCLQDAADDARGAIDRRADDDDHAIDWRVLDAVVDRLPDRPAGNILQLSLL